MTLYALEAVDDALDATRAFLRQLDRTAWAKLAAVVFFIGGTGGNVNSVPTGDGAGPTGGPPVDLGARAWLLIVAVVAVVVLLVILFAVVGSIMEFVLVESLREEAVTIRRYWSRRWTQGLRLLGFRIGLGLLVLAGLAVLTIPVIAPLLDVGPFAGVGGGYSIALLVVLVPAFLLFALAAALAYAFTTAFVVPIMILEDRGVLSAWRRLWPTIRAQWKQYLAYAVAAFLLSLVGGLIVTMVALLGIVFLLVPFGLLALLGVALYFLVAELVGIAVIAVVAVLFVVSAIAVFALARVPLATLLRYYALLVLGVVDAELDLIPERRAAIRGEAPADGGDGNGGDVDPVAG